MTRPMTRPIAARRPPPAMPMAIPPDISKTALPHDCKPVASPLQARCKADARALQDPRRAVAQTARAPGFTAGYDPLKGS